MTLTQERPPAPAITMLVDIRCSGRYEDGRPCKALLCRIDVDHWEEIIDASPFVEQKCKCGKTWHLAEYR